MLPSYENLVEAAYKIEAIDAGISEAVHSTQWAWYTLGNTRPLFEYCYVHTLISLINVEVAINMEGVQKMQNHQT